MAKKKKKSLTVNDIVGKIKPLLDPQMWKEKVAFRSETGKRLGGFYTLGAGIAILSITASTVLSASNTTYPLNLTATESIRNEINNAKNVKDELSTHTQKAKEYSSVVEEEKKHLEVIDAYLPVEVDPLSLMVHVERIAQQNGVKIEKLVLPEDRASSVVTDEVEVGENGEETTTTENTQSNDSVIGNIVSETPNSEEVAEGEEGKDVIVEKKEPLVDDMAYIINVTVVGQYSKLAGFFKDLEGTREIIEVSDVKISEYKPNIDEENKNNEEQLQVDLANFDMERITTQIDFKLKLYNKEAFLSFMNQSEDIDTSLLEGQEQNQTEDSAE